MTEHTLVRLPREAVSDDRYRVTALRIAEGQRIDKGGVIAEIESSKATFEVESPCAGFAYPACKDGDEIEVGAVLAVISRKQEPPPAELLRTLPQPAHAAAGPAPGVFTVDSGGTQVVRFSRAALDLIAQHNLEKALFAGHALVRRRDVELYLGKTQADAIRKAALTASTCDQAGPRPPAVLENSEITFLTSRHTGQRYLLTVCTPPNYEASHRSYPTLYSLATGGVEVYMVAGIARMLQFGQEIPEMILVGIGYDTDLLADRLLCRRQDLTPTAVADKPRSGGADRFLTCLRDEIAPFIDSHYRTEPGDRTVVGISHGGLFGLFALFQQPQVFNRYIVSSPSLWWDNRSFLACEETFARQHRELSARVYLSVGDQEPPVKMVAAVRDFDAIIRQRAYRGLQFTTEVLAGHTHYSSHPVSIAKGLKTVFA